MSGTASNLLPLRIRLPYTTEEEFIEKYGSNVARGGVFVATRAMKPEGTGLAFEFVLADGARLLRGEGVVVKAQVDTAGGRTGMTVRFVKLDAASKSLVDRVVARRTGGSEAPPPAQVPPQPPALTPTPPPGLVRRAPGARGPSAVRAASPSAETTQNAARTDEVASRAPASTAAAPAASSAAAAVTPDNAPTSTEERPTAGSEQPDAAVPAIETPSPAPEAFTGTEVAAASASSFGETGEEAAAFRDAVPESAQDSVTRDALEQPRLLTPRFESDSNEGLDSAIAARLAESETRRVPEGIEDAAQPAQGRDGFLQSGLDTSDEPGSAYAAGAPASTGLDVAPPSTAQAPTTETSHQENDVTGDEDAPIDIEEAHPHEEGTDSQSAAASAGGTTPPSEANSRGDAAIDAAVTTALEELSQNVEHQDRVARAPEVGAPRGDARKNTESDGSTHTSTPPDATPLSEPRREETSGSRASQVSTAAGEVPLEESATRTSADADDSSGETVSDAPAATSSLSEFPVEEKSASTAGDRPHTNESADKPAAETRVAASPISQPSDESQPTSTVSASTSTYAPSEEPADTDRADDVTTTPDSSASVTSRNSDEQQAAATASASDSSDEVATTPAASVHGTSATIAQPTDAAHPSGPGSDSADTSEATTTPESPALSHQHADAQQSADTVDGAATPAAPALTASPHGSQSADPTQPDNAASASAGSGDGAATSASSAPTTSSLVSQSSDVEQTASAAGVSADTGDGAAASITSANASQSSAPELPTDTTHVSADTGDGAATSITSALASQSSDLEPPVGTTRLSADTGDGAATSITSALASQSSDPAPPVGTPRGSADTSDGEATPASAAPTASALISQSSARQEPDATANVRAESGGDAASGPESTALGTATSLSPNSNEKQPTAGHDALASTEAGPTPDQGTPQKSDAAQTQPPLSEEPTAHDEQATSTREPSPDGAGPRVPSSTAIPAARAEPESTPAVALDSDAPRNRRRSLFEVPALAPASSPASPEVVLGIDLGTTQARVAYVQNGTPTLIPLPGTTATDLPALIAVNGNGDLVVGTSAQFEGSRAPRRAVPGLKRLLGLKPRSPQLRWLAPLLPYPVTTDTHGDAAVEVRGRVISPTLFTAMLLRELKHAAATHLGRKPTRAVICAPTHFTDRQCAALREAATLAGLDAQRILIAPAAAALAYAHGRGLARKRVLVVDLGGGGLQVCVVQVTGDDLEVITTGGDATLGGMDFDGRIAEALASDLSEQGVPKPDHPLDWMPLRAAAESTKVALSTQEQVDVTLPSGTVPPFNRERVEALTADLAQRVTTVVRDVLDSNALSPQGLDAVLLVGGQSATPMVRRRLEESLGVSVRDDVDAKNSVALGAALLGQGLLLAEAGKPAATVSEVLSTPLAVAERGGTLRRFLERNTRLPATKTLVLPCTPGPLEVALFQGTSAQASGAEYLGRVALHVDRAGEVEFHFALTADGALAVEATLPGMKRHAVALGTEPLDDAAFDALIARSPWEPAPEPRPGGLLSGIKKLFGRR